MIIAHLCCFYIVFVIMEMIWLHLAAFYGIVVLR